MTQPPEGLNGLTHAQLTRIIQELSQPREPDFTAWPFPQAMALRTRHYGQQVFLRGLIEYTSYCAQDCYYCGLRRSNPRAQRYRMSQADILRCFASGHALGFHSFVLQGGEDRALALQALCGLVERFRAQYPDSALTLSLGEMPKAHYQALRQAGADRYLLRHETANAAHFGMLHPAAQTLDSRKRCLYALREVGFQVGAGVMIGSPGQTAAHLAEDLLFMQDLQPEMVGIGPFLPHHDTPFAKAAAGTLQQTLLMLALTRLMLPAVMLPATTALVTLHPNGRALGFRAGANVVMPNLSPAGLRAAYALYDGKAATGAEAQEGLEALKAQIVACGLVPDLGRGDAVRPLC